MSVRTLIDLNVILDVLIWRKPFYETSAEIWALVESGKVEGFLAAHSLSTLFYLYARQKSSHEAQQQIRKLLQIFSIAGLDRAIIERALGLNWKDFEDALQLASAEACRADYLITRDLEGFKAKDSPVMVITPAEFTALQKGELP